MADITFGGLASGLDTKSIIKAIMAAERRPLDRLELKRTSLESRASALETLRSRLGTFTATARSLSTELLVNNRTATVSDEAKMSATAGAGAEKGIFEIEVLALATASKVKSNAITDPDQGLVADGTITLRSGALDPITIVVSATAGNNSLSAIRDTINAADLGVQASVVNDGSGYRLVVRSSETGLDNALTVTDTTNLGMAEGTNAITSAADAQLTVDGLSVTSGSNQVSGVIAGVTLNLRDETELGSPVTVEIRQNDDSAVRTVESFVSVYNELVDYFGEQFNRDKPGALYNDPLARQVWSDLQGLFVGGIEGVPLGGLRALSSIGVSVDGKTGRASLDAAELREVLETRYDDVIRLFNPGGSATSSRIRYSSATGDTASGTYAVTVTRAAEQARVSGSAPIQPSGLGQNETLTLTVGGQTVTVDLTAGQTLSQIVSTINASLRSSGMGATAIDNGGRLEVVSRNFGSGTTVSVISSLDDPGDGTSTGFSTTAASDTGVDVAGTIAGSATSGSGQLLTAGDGTDASGLTVRVTATAAEVAASAGDFGTLTYSRGLLRAFQTTLDAFTRSGSGPIDGSKQLLDDTIKSTTREIESFEARLKLREQRLIRMFSEAERAISALQSQQSQFGAMQF